MNIRITLDERRKKNDGTCPLYLTFANQGKTVYHGLGIYVMPAEFDKSTYSVCTTNKKNKVNFQRYNLLIQSELSRARNLLLSLQLSGRADIHPTKFKALFVSGSKGTNSSFISFFKSFIEKKRGRTREIYQSTLNKITGMFGDDIEFEDVNYTWLEQFNCKMRTGAIRNSKGDVIRMGMATNARAIHMRNIRAVFNKAIDEDVIGLEMYPFRRFKIEKERTRKRAVSVSHLRYLFAYSGTDAENWAVDMARLIFFLIGINTVDLFNLSEYDGEYIHYKRAKTGALYSIRVEPEAAALIEKYKGEKHLLNFCEQFKLLHSFKAKINKSLKKISEKEPNIPRMTTYTLRHTWATVAAELDIPKETIAAALGHAQNATVTDIYIDFNRKKVDEANRRVLDWVFSNIS